jgi:hypothetical protein
MLFHPPLLLDISDLNQSRGMNTSLFVLNFMDVEQYSQQSEVGIISNIIIYWFSHGYLELTVLLVRQVVGFEKVLNELMQIDGKKDLSNWRS